MELTVDWLCFIILATVAVSSARNSEIGRAILDLEGGKIVYEIENLIEVPVSTLFVGDKISK